MESPCKIALPSTRSSLQQEEHELVNMLAQWELRWKYKKTLINAQVSSSLLMKSLMDGPHVPLMCFSINFATLRFRKKDNKTSVSESCMEEKWVNYNEVIKIGFLS